MNQIKMRIFAVACLALLAACNNNYKLDATGDNNQLGGPVDPGNPDDPGTPPADIPDFACKSIQVLPLTNPLVIPARDANTGICYAVKVFDAIANSKSNLTTTIDNDVISANHDSGPATHHPYLLGRETLTVQFQGVRNIRLAGSATNDSAPILIDNFVLIGFDVASAGGLTSADYAAFGTSDSQVGSSHAVQFNGDNIPITPFASGGTATVAALDISQTIAVNQSYLIDVRAEDCGGSRELSNVYVLFK